MNEYKQEETRTIMMNMRTASRRTSNASIANALNNACERMAEMESLIFRLASENNELLQDNGVMNQRIDELEAENERLHAETAKQTTAKCGFPYAQTVAEFVASGDEVKVIPLEDRRKPGGANPIYCPDLKAMRSAVTRKTAPVDVVQRTSASSKKAFLLLIRREDS